MVIMRPDDFSHQLQHDQIVTAIRAAEQRTSGEIRVFVSRQSVDDAVVAAEKEFARLGMDKTNERNGVLIFVAPKSNQFAVIGDKGIHARCGQDFWQELANAMTVHFSRSEFTQGIVLAVHKAGEILGQFFPRTSEDRNELSDDVAHD
jgi:uncharacterized membrane protein